MLASCNNQDASSCKLFHVGTFNYVTDEPIQKSWVITRDSEFQTESNTVSGVKVVWEITWITDCDCRLKYLEGSTNPNLDPNSELRVKIIPTSDSTYESESIPNYLPDETVFKAEMVKVK